MQKIKRYLELGNGYVNFRTFVFLLMPICIFFSYYPMMSFGQASGLNFEISLLEIYLVVFVAVNLKSIWENLRFLFKNKGVWLAFAFALFNTISLFWTANFIKGFLICGMIWLLFFCYLAILCYGNLKKLLPALTKILVMSACAFSVFGLFQMFAEVIGIPKNWSLLCNGCTANQFGFARVTGFSIEPQFFGSLLLAPIFLLLNQSIKNPKARNIYAPLILLVVVLFLTVSRGAIYAFVIGAIILFIVQRKYLKRILMSVGVLAGSFLISLVIQGTCAQFNPNIDVTFYEAVSKNVHQLSLGIIDIRPEEKSSIDENAQTNETQIDPVVEDEQDKPVFDGYIEESTSIRTLLSELALRVWTQNPKNFLVGVGAGGTGFALHESFPEQMGGDTEITQNQYTEVALENGLVGLLIFGMLLAYLIWVTRKHKYLWGIFAMFLVQWLFFSGYPNALHIYLFLGICAALLAPKVGVRVRS